MSVFLSDEWFKKLENSAPELVSNEFSIISQYEISGRPGLDFLFFCGFQVFFVFSWLSCTSGLDFQRLLMFFLVAALGGNLFSAEPLMNNPQ